MFTFAIRGLAAAAAATALIGAWLYNQVSSTAAADLGAVLTRTSAAESLELKVTQDGKTGEVWVHGRKLRRNLPDGTYQIARDGKSWLVDEKANRASSQAASLFRGEAGGLDLLALLDLPTDRLGDNRKDLLAARPAEHVTRDGRELKSIAGRPRTGRHAADRGRGRCQDPIARVDRKPAGPRRADRADLKLAVIARDKPVDEELFVVGDTLTEDGRIGKVTDVARAGGHSTGDARSL